jgi:hypothetical protein
MLAPEQEVDVGGSSAEEVRETVEMKNAVGGIKEDRWPEGKRAKGESSMHVSI